MDWGLAGLENSSAAAAVAAAAVVARPGPEYEFTKSETQKTPVLGLPKPPVRADRSVSSTQYDRTPPAISVSHTESKSTKTD